MRFRLIFRARVMWADHFCHGSYRWISEGSTNKQFKVFPRLQWLLATYESSPCAYIFRCPTNECRWVSAKTGNVRLALGCCRLSVTLAVRKTIPSSIQSHSLDLVVGQVILSFTQQEGCYRWDSNPLLLTLIERRNLSLQSRVEQRLCQSITRRIFFVAFQRKVDRFRDEIRDGFSE